MSDGRLSRKPGRRHPAFVGCFRAKHWPIYKAAIRGWHAAHPPRRGLLERQVTFRSNADFCEGHDMPLSHYNLFVEVDCAVANGIVTTRPAQDTLRKRMTRKFITEFLLPRLREARK